MSDVVQNVQTNFLIGGQANAQLSVLANSARRVTGLFDRASGIVGMFGSVAAVAAGAFSVTKMIKGTQDFLGQVKKIQDYTSASASSAGGMLESMSAVGIEGDEATRTIMMMSKAGARFDSQMLGVNRHLGGQQRLFKSLGVDIRSGPEDALIKMSEKAKLNKLTINDLSLAFRLSGETARKFMGMLKLGPDHIRKTRDEFDKLGIATQENVNVNEQIKKIGYEIKGTWNNILITIGVQLLPVIRDMMDRMATGLKEWLPKAKAFGEALSGFLRDHLGIVKAITKVLLLNFALMKMTGTGMSGWGGRVGGRLMRGMAPGGAISGVLGKQTTIRGEVSTLIEILKARKGGMSVLSGETLPVAKTPTVVSAVVAMFSRTGPMFTRIAPIMLRFATTVLRWFPLITLILIIIGVVRSAIQTIRQNINSVGTYLSEIVNTIRDRFSVIGDMFSSIVGPVRDIVDSLGMIGDFFNDQMSGFLAMAGTLMDGIMHTIQTIIYMIANLRKAILYPVETFKKGWEITGKLTAEKTRQREIAAIERKMAEIRKRKKDAEDTRPPKTVNDFRGSHFSIDQRFAEGFDPDRIALAFSSDLAKIGERQLNSNYSPAFAR